MAGDGSHAVAAGAALTVPIAGFLIALQGSEP
jgi:hypothetical protein